jgi:hypothetical protein
MHVYGGLPQGETNGREGGKEMTLRCEEDGSTLHIYIWRQHNETHQTLFEKERYKGEGNGNIMGDKLVQDTVPMHGIIMMKSPLIINIWLNQKENKTLFLTILSP